MDLANGALGPSGKYDLQFADKHLVITVEYDAQGMTGALTIKVDASVLLDELSKAIPGTIDDSVLSLIKAAL